MAKRECILNGLKSRPEWNGPTGRIHSYDAEKDRYQVTIASGGSANIKPGEYSIQSESIYIANACVGAYDYNTGITPHMYPHTYRWSRIVILCVYVFTNTFTFSFLMSLFHPPFPSTRQYHVTSGSDSRHSRPHGEPPME
jgi:hypothetical protein